MISPLTQDPPEFPVIVGQRTGTAGNKVLEVSVCVVFELIKVMNTPSRLPKNCATKMRKYLVHEDLTEPRLQNASPMVIAKLK